MTVPFKELHSNSSHHHTRRIETELRISLYPQFMPNEQRSALCVRRLSGRIFDSPISRHQNPRNPIRRVLDSRLLYPTPRIGFETRSSRRNGIHRLDTPGVSYGSVSNEDTGRPSGGSITGTLVASRRETMGRVGGSGNRRTIEFSE